MGFVFLYLCFLFFCLLIHMPCDVGLMNVFSGQYHPEGAVAKVHLALSRHEKHSKEFSVSILFLPEMVYYLHQLGDAYASGGQPI